MIKCPNCGKSHYSEGASMCTAMYFPPVWKDGINTNPDRNTTTTYAHCCECHYDFLIKRQGDEIWTELGKYNPPAPVPTIKINANEIDTTEYVPDKTMMRTSLAVVDKDGNPMREKTQVEKDIEKINYKLDKLYKMIEELAGEIYAISSH